MIARSLIMWMVRRTEWWKRHPMTQWLPDEGRHQRVANRYMPFLPDEVQRGDDTIHRALPRWAPFNALLHHWVAHEDVLMHDHPRRSVTIVLRGELVERTPWGERRLRPGSVVVRGHRFIHGFRVEPEHSARTWTLFLVGRRSFLQNTYEVRRRTETPER